MAKLLAFLSTYLGSARISVVAHHVWLVPQFCPRRLGLEVRRGSLDQSESRLHSTSYSSFVKKQSQFWRLLLHSDANFSHA